MKTISIEVDPEAAKYFLVNLEETLSAKLRERDELTAEISRLESSARKMRDQLQGENGFGMRRPRGENRQRIVEYLKKLPPGSKGAKMSGISKSTGISVSSTNFTLRNYIKYFEQDKETKLWKLK